MKQIRSRDDCMVINELNKLNISSVATQWQITFKRIPQQQNHGDYQERETIKQES